MFSRYVLRTTDVPAARAFYAEVIGLPLPEGMTGESTLEAWPLHERALARGAPPHWLGHLATDDVKAMVDRLVGLGSEALGPIVHARDGTPLAALRDPFGAVIGIRAAAGRVSAPVVWHQLHTCDAEGAWAMYRDLFGWSQTQMLEAPHPVGGFRSFGWTEGGAAVGAIGNTARSPGVHTHWLFHLRVADVDQATARVRAFGGTASTPIEAFGMRLVACEDPQGAAFGLAQPV